MSKISFSFLSFGKMPFKSISSLFFMSKAVNNNLSFFIISFSFLWFSHFICNNSCFIWFISVFNCIFFSYKDSLSKYLLFFSFFELFLFFKLINKEVSSASLKKSFFFVPFEILLYEFDLVIWNILFMFFNALLLLFLILVFLLFKLLRWILLFFTFTIGG